MGSFFSIGSIAVSLPVIRRGLTGSTKEQFRFCNAGDGGRAWDLYFVDLNFVAG